MVALCLLPILGLIGLAVDFGFIAQSRAALDMAADSAALSAAKTAANAASAGTANPAALGQAAGQQWFAAQTRLLGNATTSPATVTVNQSGTVFTATVRYQGSVSLFFGPLFGVSTASIGNTSVGTMTSNTYVDITFLLDNSSSMLVASTEAGITKLNGLTQPFAGTVPGNLKGYQCAFACHWQTDPSQADYYSVARQNNIQLRTDVLQLAVWNAIQTMQQDAVVANQFRVGVATFDSGLNQVYPAGSSPAVTTDLKDAAAAVQAIPVPCCADVANTYFPNIMSSLASALSPSGDGSSPASPKKVLMIVTDGMTDYPPRQTPTSRGPIDPTNCNAIKALGYAVYVLYTPYSSDDSALLFNGDLKQYLTGSPSQMDTALQQCASSPATFADAADPATIIADLNQMLLAAIGSAGRFTQ